MRRHRDTHEDSHAKVEAEVAVMLPQVRERQAPPETGRGRKDSSLEPLEGADPANTLNSDFSLQNYEKISFCCFYHQL